MTSMTVVQKYCWIYHQDHQSVSQFSCSVVSNSLRPHGLQHARPPCPSATPGVYSNSCPLSQWCHPTISSSVIPFSSHLQSFPASGSFPVSQLFTSGGQNIRVSASTSISMSISLYNLHLYLFSLYLFLYLPPSFPLSFLPSFLSLSFLLLFYRL